MRFRGYSEANEQLLKSPSLTITQIDAFVNTFIELVLLLNCFCEFCIIQFPFEMSFLIRILSAVDVYSCKSDLQTRRTRWSRSGRLSEQCVRRVEGGRHSTERRATTCVCRWQDAHGHTCECGACIEVGLLIMGDRHSQCCPGYVGTDMTSHKGPLTIDEGAATPVWLATLPAGATSPAGQFCFECAVYTWWSCLQGSTHAYSVKLGTA
jgi:hypothetical protein